MARTVPALLIGSVFLGNSAAASCRGATGLVASALAGYPPAQTFCSQQFPLPAETRTSVAPLVTVTSTVGTTTSTTIVATDATTVTPYTSTTTNVDVRTFTFIDSEVDVITTTVIESTTVLTTVTTTAGSNNKRDAAETPIITTSSVEGLPTPVLVHYLPDTNDKRDAFRRHPARAADPRLAQLSSLRKQASTFVGGVCTCLEKPVVRTITTTPSTTLLVTATAATSVTTSSTATVTATFTTFVTSFAPPVTRTFTFSTTTATTTTLVLSQTTTTTALASSIPADVPCGQTAEYGGYSLYYACDFRRASGGAALSAPTGLTFTQCRDALVANGPNFGADFDFASGLCTLYSYPGEQVPGGRYAISAAPGVVFVDVADFVDAPTIAT